MEILQKAGFTPRVIAPDINELPLDFEDASHYVQRLAFEKADVVRAQTGHESAVIVAADTIVVLDGKILGKPVDSDDARQMLTALSGKSHTVMTGVCLMKTDGEILLHDVEKTHVTFRAITPAEINDDIASGEPMDKAGAYAIQGRAGRYVVGIDGLMSNVVGLPIEKVLAFL